MKATERQEKDFKEVVTVVIVVIALILLLIYVWPLVFGHVEKSSQGRQTTTDKTQASTKYVTGHLNLAIPRFL